MDCFTGYVAGGSWILPFSVQNPWLLIILAPAVWVATPALHSHSQIDRLPGRPLKRNSSICTPPRPYIPRQIYVRKFPIKLGAQGVEPGVVFLLHRGLVLMSIHPTIIQISTEPRKSQPSTQGYQFSLVPPLLILQLEPKYSPKTVSYAD